MKRRLALSMATALAGTWLALGAAWANSNFFRPISGAEFAAFPPVCVHRDGSLVSTQGCTTSASLGHAAGGTNGFTIFGANNGQTLTCRITSRDGQDDGFPGPTAQGSTTVAGFFSMHLVTNLVSGPDIYYTVSCDLPPGSEITGVTPDN